jgi:GNAT superfamily N-acetyltransferase
MQKPSPTEERQRELRGRQYLISTDPEQLDVRAIHSFLTRSDWAAGISLSMVERSIAGSLCFGLREGSQQIGFARVVTDRATFAYLCDVYVEEGYRRQGLARWLLEAVRAHPDLSAVRRFVLVTRNAHKLYEQFGFSTLGHPERFMEAFDPEVYAKPRAG